MGISRRTALVIALGLVSASNSAAQSTIDTRSAPGLCCNYAGGAGLASYGQSFTIFQAGLTVIDFSFWILPLGVFGPGDFMFRTVLASVQQDGSFGSPLFTSSTTAVPLGTPAQFYSFTTGLNSPLAPGKYVAIVQGVGGLPFMPIANGPFGGSTYAGGEILFPSAIDPTGPWVDWGFGYDTEFYANLGQATVTPEPATMVLVASGLAGIGAMARRRQRRRRDGEGPVSGASSA